MQALFSHTLLWQKMLCGSNDELLHFSVCATSRCTHFFVFKGGEKNSKKILFKH